MSYTLRVNSEYVTFNVYSPGYWDMDTGKYVEEIDVTVEGTEPIEVENGRDYTLTITAHEGYIIHEAWAYIDVGYDEFTISEDGTVATLEKENLDMGMDVTITVDVEYVPDDSDISGFNYLYKVDKDILKQMSDIRFSIIIGDEVVGDLGDYIINILELPFPLHEDMIGNKDKIRLGMESIDVEAHRILVDEWVLDLGTIEVAGKYNNSFDLLNTEVQLHLPFVDTITLEPEYVIYQTLKIEYVIDLYTGEGTVNVRTSKLNDNICNSQTFKIGRDIPFVTKSGDVQGSLRPTNNGISNNIYRPFVEVIRNVPYNTDSPYNDNITEYVERIGDKTGFVIVNEIDLKTSASLQEKNNIMSLLRNGVVIK